MERASCEELEELVEPEVETKEISDLALTAFLTTYEIGWKLIGVKPEGKRLVFILESSPEIENDILAYYNHSAKVDPLAFSESLRNLKSILFNRRHV